MKKLVFSACALTLTGSTVVANDSDWAQLDKDVQALSASLQDMESTGLSVGGRVRAAWDFSGDIEPNGAGNGDLGGFAIYNARLYASGTTAGDIGYHFEFDFAGNNSVNAQGIDFTTSGLLDAYLDIPIAQDISVRVGQFRAFVLNESQIDSGNLFFFDRSVHSTLFAGRRKGAAIGGSFDSFDWAFTLQNGGDGIADEYFWAVRGGFDLMGEGTGMVEGAYGAGEEMTSSIGISYFDDGAIDDANGWAFEGTLASNQFSLQAVVLGLGDAASASQLDVNDRNPFLNLLVAATGSPGAAVGIVADATPWAIGGTFMLTEPTSDYGAWEIGARFQDLDDANSTRILDVGANYYAQGHDMKYIIGWTNTSSDVDAFEVDIFRLGVNARL